VSRKPRLKFDEIGYWSQIKLDIVKDYAAAYSTILTAQTKYPFHHSYIDGFAGAGKHLSKSTGTFVLGSPLNALHVKPPFKEYHLIDLDQTKISNLKAEIGDRKDVHIHYGDCNSILLNKVYPSIRFEDYRRALCLLDPYGLHLNWEVIKTAGQGRAIDLFLNFPVADMNRNVLWHDPDGVDPADIDRMNAFWGDDSWRQAAYTTERDLFKHLEKESNDAVAESFRKRLQKIAGFANVPKPLPMRNTQNAVVYYLFFASQKPVAGEIVRDIFKKYQKLGSS